MVLHNINVVKGRNDELVDEEVLKISDEIGVGKKHENYEDLITRAEDVISKHGCNANSATVQLVEAV